MTNEEVQIINKLNDMNTDFGVIDLNILNSSNINHKKFYYFFPVLERLVRFILHANGECDIENYNNNSFKTMYSIIENNQEIIVECLGVYVFHFLENLYKKDGIRNKLMHYSVKTVEYDRQLIERLSNLIIELVIIYISSITDD